MMIGGQDKDLCNQTSTLSNSAEIVKNMGWVKNTPLRLNKTDRRIK